MCQTGISVWFVCRLCRGSFGQVDAFIEHKKQKHFTQFQNTTSIVFEESEQGLLYPEVTNGDPQLQDISNEPPIKIEVTDEDPIIPCSPEIIDEPNLDLLEPKSELMTFECEENPDNENNFVGLKQPEQNPYVLLERLTSEEIQSACVPQHPTRLLPIKQEIFESNLKHPSTLSPVVPSSVSDLVKVEESAETQSSLSVRNISTEDGFQFECKLCSKQLESDAQLKIHVGICALYHEDRNRFCVLCNQKFSNTNYLKDHHLRFHGTEEEKSSLNLFRCHVCSKQYRKETDLRFHLESHKETKQKDVKTSESKPAKCSFLNCGKEFRFNCFLQRHLSAVHLGVKPFGCLFPNCNKRFALSSDVDRHFRTHTGERPYKCTVDNCKKAFRTSSQKLRHHRTVHRDLLRK